MKKSLLVLLLCILFSGCQTRSSAKNEVVFKEYESILIDRSFSPCSLIESIEGEEATEHSYSEDKIVLKDTTLLCNKNNTALAIGEVGYTFNYKGLDIYKTVVFYDDVAPTITTDDVYEVEQGNTYFALNNHITIEDNFDDLSNVFVGQTGFY